MKSVGTYEAKTHLAELLLEVAQGQKITITKHGLPVAMLVPVETTSKHEAIKAAELLKQSQRIKLPKGLSIKDLIEEGRR